MFTTIVVITIVKTVITDIVIVTITIVDVIIIIKTVITDTVTDIVIVTDIIVITVAIVGVGQFIFNFRVVQ